MRQPYGLFWRTRIANDKITITCLGRRYGVPLAISLADFKTLFEVSIGDNITGTLVTQQYYPDGDKVTVLSPDATVQLINRFF